jgi:hypothetical protein
MGPRICVVVFLLLGLLQPVALGQRQQRDGAAMEPCIGGVVNSGCRLTAMAFVSASRPTVRRGW